MFLALVCWDIVSSTQKALVRWALVVVQPYSPRLMPGHTAMPDIHYQTSPDLRQGAKSFLW